MTQCKCHHGYKTAEITLLCHKVLCSLYTVSITSVQKGHSNYATFHLYPAVVFAGRDPENSVLLLTWSVTFTTAGALPSSAVILGWRVTFTANIYTQLDRGMLLLHHCAGSFHRKKLWLKIENCKRVTGKLHIRLCRCDTRVQVRCLMLLMMMNW